MNDGQDSAVSLVLTEKEMRSVCLGLQDRVLRTVSSLPAGNAALREEWETLQLLLPKVWRSMTGNGEREACGTETRDAGKRGELRASLRGFIKILDGLCASMGEGYDGETARESV